VSSCSAPSGSPWRQQRTERRAADRGRRSTRLDPRDTASRTRAVTGGGERHARPCQMRGPSSSYRGQHVSERHRDGDDEASVTVANDRERRSGPGTCGMEDMTRSGPTPKDGDAPKSRAAAQRGSASCGATLLTARRSRRARSRRPRQAMSRLDRGLFSLLTYRRGLADVGRRAIARADRHGDRARSRGRGRRRPGPERDQEGPNSGTDSAACGLAVGSFVEDLLHTLSSALESPPNCSTMAPGIWHFCEASVWDGPVLSTMS
jgi:hypothetical protein